MTLPTATLPDLSDFAPLIDLIDIGVVLHDFQGRVVLWNGWVASRSGISADLALGRTLVEIFPELRGTRLEGVVKAALSAGQAAVLSRQLNPRLLPLKDPGGKPIIQSAVVRPILLAGETFCLLQIRDETASASRDKLLRENQRALSAAHEEVEIAKEWYRNLLDSAPDGILVVDDQGIIIQCNQAMDEMFGYDKGELLGQPLDTLLPEEERGRHLDIVQGFIHGGSDKAISISPRDITGLHKSGSLVPIEIGLRRFPLLNGEGFCAVAAARDVTLRRKAAQELSNALDVIQEMARRDELTRCFNRRHLMHVLPQKMEEAADEHKPLSMLIFDIDHFKSVNDTHGHLVGDLVLKTIAEKVQSVLRGEDLFVRYGGEEFVCVLPKTPLQAACDVAERIRATLGRTSIQAGEATVSVTLSLGVAAYQAPDEVMENWLARADQALYEAKRSGRNRVVVAA